MKNSTILAGLLIFSTTAVALDNSGYKPAIETTQRIKHETPYDIDNTLQTFTKTVHGGVQHVVAKSADDAQLIKSIQANLFEIANNFKKGNFSISERKHGTDMPGLAKLKTAQTDDIKFEYKTLDNGAQIHYSTENTQFVQALHQWFDAQTMDHSNNVIPGHNQHHSNVSE